MYGRNGVAAAVGQHGAFDVGVVHLHHEGARDAGALLQPQARLHVLILLSNTRHFTIREPMGTRWAAEILGPRCPHFFFSSYTSGGTIPDVVAGISAAVAGVVCGETGARLGAIATK